MQLTSIKKWLELAPLFLIMVPFYVLVHLEKVFHHLIDYRYAANQIIILLLACIACFFIGRLMAKDRRKSWVIAFVLMLFWCYLGLIKNFLELNYHEYFFSSYIYFLPFAVIVLAALIFLIKKRSINFSRLFLFANSVWILFILIDVLSMLAYDIQKPSLERKYALNLPKIAIADSIKPNIYYIVFDSYSSNAILQQMGSDNEAIEKKLSNKGFKIINNGSSNYNLTPFSIGSTLNMRYLDEASTSKKYTLDAFLPGVKIVKYNGLLPWLVKQGYGITNFSFFDFPGIPVSIKIHDIWGIEEVYFQHNAAWKIYYDISWNFGLPGLFNAEKMYNAIGLRDDTVFHRLVTASSYENNKPRFVYAHFFMPHTPNSRDSLGNKIPVNAKLTGHQAMTRYTEEIKFVNKRIDSITDVLLANSMRPLVIIIQGDHGYRFYDESRKDDEFPNFCAVFFSNRDYRHLPDSISNVNLFKAVLNTWFNQHVPLDVNRHYFLHYQ